jgi:tetratricopeptide (TPR) repeat protein
LEEIKESLNDQELAEWEAVQKKFRARMRGMIIFCLLLAVPIGIGAYLVLKMKAGLARDKAWAEAELKKAEPNPLAYGALGTMALNEGRVAEALPLLKKASALEAASKSSVQAHLIFVEAQLEGVKHAVAGGSKDEAQAALKELLGYADALPQGQRAAAWHGAGKLYAAMDEKEKARECLKKASELQPDDWVDEGGGRRYKHRGIASTYQKDYAGALYQ